MNRKSLVISGVSITSILLCSTFLAQKVWADEVQITSMGNSELIFSTTTNSTVEDSISNNESKVAQSGEAATLEKTSVQAENSPASDEVNEHKKIEEQVSDSSVVTTDSKKHLEATISEEKPKVRALRSVGTTATAVPRTEKSKQYIESIKGEYKYNNAVYTIRTKEDITKLSFSAFYASTGAIHESKSIEKINNRTFEARLLSPLKGDWRSFSMQLTTEDGIVELNRKDLLDQKVSVLTKGATRKVDQNLTLKNGKQITVAMNKNSAINTDIIKYTIKVAGETYSTISTIKLINDRTGKTHHYTPGYGTRSLDDNGNAVIYYKVDTTELDYGNYQLNEIWYKKGGETQYVKYPNFSYKIIRPHLLSVVPSLSRLLNQKSGLRKLATM